MKPLSIPQIQKLAALARRAFDLVKARAGAIGPDVTFDDWRHDQCQAACGKPSMKQMNNTSDFEACMLHFAILAEEHETAAYYAVATERRCRHTIRDQLAKLGALEGATYTWDYAVRICVHMQLPLSLDECPAELLVKVVMALDSQIRRIRASRGDLTPRAGNEGLGTRRARREHGKVVAA